MQQSWWQDAVFYHIYPRSFQDTDGDGIGDLAGIISRLDYLTWLGIDAIWLSPIFPSPMVDFGYDISNFCDIDAMFGTLETFDSLIAEAHRRGIRVMIDQVYHCTSSHHPWFRESRSSRDNAKADWFIWRDPAPDGGPPNNWLSFFSGEEPVSAWQWCEQRGQYYLHLFSADQCDLDLRNPEVQAALEQVTRFWLDRGVDGFRLDSVSVLFKDPSFEDYVERREIYAPSAFSALSRFHVDRNLERPENLLALERIRAITNEYHPERVTVGESASEKGIIAYLDISFPGRLNMAFNFQFLNAVSLDAQRILEAVERTETVYDSRAWPCYVTGHHDGQRVLSRVLGDNLTHRVPVARAIGTILLTLRGTPFIYYGEELGMVNTPIPRDRLLDPFGIAIWPEPGRDVARTPMQWDTRPNCGFTTGEPWLPVHEDDRSTNVEVERDDPRSVLSWYRSLLALRRREATLRRGRWSDAVSEGNVLAFTRTTEHDAIAVAVSLSSEEAALPAQYQTRPGSVLLGTDSAEGTPVGAGTGLAPYGVVIWRLAP